MDQFAEILNKNLDELPRFGATFPSGTYLMQVQGPYTLAKTGNPPQEVVDMIWKILQIKDDVNADEVAALAGGVVGREYRARFFDAGNLADCLEGLGIAKGTQLREALAEAPGKQVWVTLGQRPSPDGSRMYNQIKGYAKV